MLIRQFRQLVALDDFEARITAKDLIERVRDTLLIKCIFTLQESLLLAGVQDNKAWHFTFFEVEHCGELGLGGHVQSHETKCDAALNLALEGCLDVIKCLHHFEVGLCG